MAEGARQDAAAGASLLLFMSRFSSLGTWRDAGILGRELALYRRLAERGVKVGLVSYGGVDEAALAADCAEIEVFYNRWKLPPRVYEALLPLLFRNRFRRYRVFKTNQMNGALTALRASRLCDRPLVARMGYLWSEFEADAAGADSRAARRARSAEERVWRHARRIVVTTEKMVRSVTARLPELSSRVLRIPNYVDTGLFAPQEIVDPGRPVLYVGRFSEQKNLEALLDAARIGAWPLLMVGAGKLEQRLRSIAAERGIAVEWRGRMAHERLPLLFRQEAGIFVLPSLYEGHPKILLEAMACGMAVVGADRPGIRELIDHGQTGLLCAPTGAGINAAVKRLRGDPELAVRLGAAARRYALREFSLDAVVDAELALIGKLAAVEDGQR